MIHTGDQPASLYIGTVPVKEAYLGATKVYPNREPVITVEYSAWTTRSLSLSASGSQIPATGGSISISATAHQTRTKTTLSDGVPIATEQETQSVSVVPALSSNNGAFRVSGATVSCDHRHAVEGDRLSATITGSYGGASATLTLYQQENKPKSYAYRVVVVSSGISIPYSGGSTTVLAKSQRAPTYTTEEQGSYADTNEQSISARISGSGFSIAPMTKIDGFDVPFNVSASSHTSTSQRTATVTFTGSIGGSASTTVRQAGMPQSTVLRYTYSDQPSQYPRFIRNGPPSMSVSRTYTSAITSTIGNTVTYHNGAISDIHSYDLAPYVSINSYSIGFNQETGAGFMHDYPYTYGTVDFKVTGGNPSKTFSCMALFEKNYRDFEAAGYPSWNLPVDPNNRELQLWEPLNLLSAEQTVLRALASDGVVMLSEEESREVDLAALSAKINAARRPDTNRYEQSEDGSWRVIPAGEATEE